MLTADQHARLPALLRDIVDHDRKSAQLADELFATPVSRIHVAHLIRVRRETRAEMTAGARHLYGRAPLRGDTGPGRPTAARA